MFSTTYQSGLSGVEVLTPSGKNPPARLIKINGPSSLITKDYERDIKGYKYTLSGRGNQSSSIQCPAASRDTLALTQPLLIFQLKCNQDDPLNLEIVVLDSSNQRRRFLISTTFRSMDITALHAQVPWVQDSRDTWTNVFFHLPSMTQQCFSAKFASIDSFHLRPMCSLRKIFTLPESIMLDVDGVGGLLVPAAFSFPLGTTSKNFLFSLRPPVLTKNVPPSDLQISGQQLRTRRGMGGPSVPSASAPPMVPAVPARRGSANPTILPSGIASSAAAINQSTAGARAAIDQSTAGNAASESYAMMKSEMLVAAGNRAIDNNRMDRNTDTRTDIRPDSCTNSRPDTRTNSHEHSRTNSGPNSGTDSGRGSFLVTDTLDTNNQSNKVFANSVMQKVRRAMSQEMELTDERRERGEMGMIENRREKGDKVERGGQEESCHTDALSKLLASKWGAERADEGYPMTPLSLPMPPPLMLSSSSQLLRKSSTSMSDLLSGKIRNEEETKRNITMSSDPSFNNPGKPLYNSPSFDVLSAFAGAPSPLRPPEVFGGFMAGSNSGTLGSLSLHRSQSIGSSAGELPRASLGLSAGESVGSPRGGLGGGLMGGLVGSSPWVLGGILPRSGSGRLLVAREEKEDGETKEEKEVRKNVENTSDDNQNDNDEECGGPAPTSSAPFPPPFSPNSASSQPAASASPVRPTPTVSSVATAATPTSLKPPITAATIAPATTTRSRDGNANTIDETPLSSSSSRVVDSVLEYSEQVIEETDTIDDDSSDGGGDADHGDDDNDRLRGGGEGQDNDEGERDNEGAEGEVDVSVGMVLNDLSHMYQDQVRDEEGGAVQGWRGREEEDAENGVTGEGKEEVVTQEGTNDDTKEGDKVGKGGVEGEGVGQLGWDLRVTEQTQKCDEDEEDGTAQNGEEETEEVIEAEGEGKGERIGSRQEEKGDMDPVSPSTIISKWEEAADAHTASTVDTYTAHTEDVAPTAIGEEEEEEEDHRQEAVEGSEGHRRNDTEGSEEEEGSSPLIRSLTLKLDSVLSTLRMKERLFLEEFGDSSLIGME